MRALHLAYLNTFVRTQVLGEYEEFMEGVELVAKFTNFDNDFVVSVFEVTIRSLGCAPLFLRSPSLYFSVFE